MNMDKKNKKSSRKRKLALSSIAVAGATVSLSSVALSANIAMATTTTAKQNIVFKTSTDKTLPKYTITSSNKSSGIYGVDLASHINPSWSSWKKSGVQFAWSKATEGISYKSPVHATQVKNAHQNGVVVGSYHFAQPNRSSGRSQADYFVANGGGWRANTDTMVGALDIEYNPSGDACYGMSRSQMNSWIRSFIEEYMVKTGTKPVIYTDTSWFNRCVGNYDYRDTPLWLARYSTGPLDMPFAWSGTQQMTWQRKAYTNYDADVFNGTLAQLHTYANTGSISKAFYDSSATKSLPKNTGYVYKTVTSPDSYFRTSSPVVTDANHLPISGTWVWHTTPNTISFNH